MQETEPSIMKNFSSTDSSPETKENRFWGPTTNKRGRKILLFNFMRNQKDLFQEGADGRKLFFYDYSMIMFYQILLLWRTETAEKKHRTT